MVLYATGGGIMSPAGVDGLVTTLSPPYPMPTLPVSVTIDVCLPR